MTSAFGALWRGAYPQLEGAFGESQGFIFMPSHRVDQNATASPDPTRQGTPFTGIFDAEPEVTRLEARGRAGSWSEPVIGAPPQLDCPAAAFITPPKTGDWIMRLSDGARYQISEVRPSDLGRLILHLNKA